MGLDCLVKDRVSPDGEDACWGIGGLLGGGAGVVGVVMMMVPEFVRLVAHYDQSNSSIYQSTNMV